MGSPIERSDGLLALSDGTLAAVSGIGSAAAGIAARTLVEAGATSLVSWGLAGGLDPALAAGSICLPILIVSQDGTTFSTDPRWRDRLTAAAGTRHCIVGGKLLTSASAIQDVAGKAAAFRQTGAVAVDMESSGVAQVAATHNLPCIAVRVIVDTAADVLPAAISAATRSGHVRLSRLISGLVGSPRDLVPLLRLAKRYRTAMRTLVAVARTGALSPHFAAARSARIA